MSGQNTRTSLGLSENIEAILSYVFGWLTGAIFLVLEKENKFVRFHALQSLVTFLGLFILSTVIRLIPILGLLLSPLIAIASMVLWLVLLYKAYIGEKYKLPVIGTWVEKQIDKE
ncbi:DUF4870 domain-containing protein [Pelosinus sp. IPA-1]|uniref:DUF4870 domain-containing protein n=1 Tax=Pelosinus sp. IPA-1 TaxID=3029569 RepID=UPI0024361FD2|nr:DUF4870 domain-containing protein [Pelosinus sp. IPA-1]GMB01528.1 membrane protein [Pelosinus sp. IPA-1]